MKFKHIILPFIATSLGLSSCSDFLDREPLTDNVNEGFFTEPGQLQAYCNKRYNLLPDFSANEHLFTLDQNSDNQAATDPKDLFLPQRIKVAEKNGYNQQGDLRDCNHFLYYTQENLKSGILENSNEVRQYIGEMYFFRAYVYFNYLKKFGDFPIIKEELTVDDYAANVEANKRKPRNEVARFIIEGLDAAIERLFPQSNALTNHRLNKESALLFKSRVALYEASWETYHKGTARVPGGPGWPGGTFDGNLDTEIDFFLTQAMDAAKQVTEAVTITDKIEDYMNMFNQYDLSSNKEVLLWRMYSADAKVNSLVEGQYHSIYNEKGEGCVGLGGGYTRSMVETFLTTNGLPIYDPENQEYKGDKSIPDVMENRDLRLVECTFKPGDMVWRGANLDQDGRMVYTNLLQAYQNLGRTATGYLVRKGWRDSNVAPTDNSPLAYMIFRATEAYLNYMEADVMKNGKLDDFSKKYWKALRKRAGVSEDFQKTIDHTDLDKENDLAVWSGNTKVSTLLYNVRRERRCEFIAEGMRTDDLFRWRSLDKMKNYQIEGFNWEEYKTQPYYVKQLAAGLKIKDTKYLQPHALNELVTKNNGYTFEEANYLTPISYDVFHLSTPAKGGDPKTSVVY
ncbi:MAG: RagB/SusD family nutrient uptake outer membrane protein [Bacteroides sp.]|nr:RagB/SusD family nutrient uptake outer membrane protein [Bacteroides sp.]